MSTCVDRNFVCCYRLTVLEFLKGLRILRLVLKLTCMSRIILMVLYSKGVSYNVYILERVQNLDMSVGCVESTRVNVCKGTRFNFVQIGFFKF